MQAIASSTSERMPMMCDGSSFSTGNRKPVALVRMVKSRNIAVRPGILLEPRRPNMTMMPATMAIRLMITCSVVNVAKLIPRIMTLPLFETGECYDYRWQIVHMRVVPTAIQIYSIDHKSRRYAQVFCMAVTNRANDPSYLAIEKF